MNGVDTLLRGSKIPVWGQSWYSRGSLRDRYLTVTLRLRRWGEWDRRMTYVAGSPLTRDSRLRTGKWHADTRKPQVRKCYVTKWHTRMAMHNVNTLYMRCRGLYRVVSVLHTQLLAHPESFAGHTRPFAEATRSSSRSLTLDYVNCIQARKSHKSVNCMQLNGIRVGLFHNVNALHRRLYTRLHRLNTTV